MTKKKYYYSNKNVLRVNIIDVLTREKITPEAIYINGTEITSWTSDSTYNCIISGVPFSFILVVLKDGYWDHNRSWTFDLLDTQDVTLVPQQEVDSFNMEVHWTPPIGTAYDLDLHMIILDAATEEPVSDPYHLYYSAGGSGDGYVASITKGSDIYKLNYDDDAGEHWGSTEGGDTQNNHTENITGPLVSGNIYRFIVEDWAKKDSGSTGHMNSTDCPVTATLTFDGPGTVQSVSSDNTSTYWIICQLKETTIEGHTYWIKDTTVSEYTDSEPYLLPSSNSSD